VIDAGMRENGCQETSYNFGVEGMVSVERDALLQRLLSDRPKTLKVIVTEDVMPSISINRDNNFLSDRIRYFYSAGNLSKFLDSLLSYPEVSEIDRVKRLVLLAVGYLYEYSGIGDLAELMPKVGTGRQVYSKSFLNNRGYLPLEAETDAWFAMRKRTFIETTQWIILDERRQQKQARGIDEHLQEAIDFRAAHVAERLKNIRALGVRPVFLVVPQERPDVAAGIAGALRSYMDDVTVLNYNDEERYPAFYERELWFDTFHFNDNGARMISQEIGRDLCRAIKDHG
jgi:hypothetical protein